jgi:hypothetical protein
MKLLFLTPPMTQVNTPYPATAYLTGHFRLRGWDAHQADPALELVLRLFSRAGLTRVLEELRGCRKLGPLAHAFLKDPDVVIDRVDAAIAFLQGRDPALAIRIAGREFLPEGPRFEAAQDDEHLHWAFGTLGTEDRARFFASLFLDDLADLIKESIDPRFEFSRYGEKLAASQSSFDAMDEALSAEPTLLDQMLEEIVAELIARHEPDVVGLTTPFPGSVYCALRMGRQIHALRPKAKVVWGGGYVNTELRDLEDPRVFESIDAIVQDDGERPLELLLEYYAGKLPRERLLRTALLDAGQVRWFSDPSAHDVPFSERGTPTMQGLPLGRYLRIFEMLNPMNRLWTDYSWNKVTVASGCYWKKCTFCDTSLPYIGSYEPQKAQVLLERMDALYRETGQSGFHFVDEAAPPAALRALSELLIKRGSPYSWWGNIRFEKSYTRALCKQMAEAGCIAVTGGLEVASNRLLDLIQKGVSVEQVARVTRAFTEAGVFTHAYLMYGFPSQTVQETIDSLEVVRQLFVEGCLHSGFWHRFSATVHSPVGRAPEKYGIRLMPPVRPAQGWFSRNDVPFYDPLGVDHDALGVGLRAALYNYMQGAGLETPVRKWFPMRVPDPQVPKTLVARAMKS